MSQEICACLHPIKRNNYFHGQLLTTKDFQNEQDYFREKQRMLNRCLHGWGIICGLSVSVQHNDVRVKPGVALDCQGNEIVVPGIVNIPLPDSVADQYVVIEYFEKLCDYVPVIGVSDADSQPTRVEESYLISCQSEEPPKKHTGIDSNCECCKDAHAILLAKIIHRRGRWSIRTYSGRRRRWWLRLLMDLIRRKKCALAQPIQLL